MKLFILIIAITFFSCSKQSVQPESAQPASAAIISMNYGPEFQDGNAYVKFNLSISVTGDVKQLNLVNEMINGPCDYIKVPVSGNYLMYDRSTGGTYPKGKTYHFEWVFKNGAVVKEKSFTVY